MKRKTILAWSGGKDSTASAILCHDLGIHVDEIVFVEVMYSHERGISAEDPDQIAWVKTEAKPKLEDMGFCVEIISSYKDAEGLIHKPLGDRSQYAGMMRGFPIPGRCMIESELKLQPMRRRVRAYEKAGFEVLSIVGIACDEVERLKRLKPTDRSVLAEARMTEDDALELCKERGLLAPCYRHSTRSGCWLCPNIRNDELLAIKRRHPEIWNEITALGQEQDLANPFMRRGERVADVIAAVELAEDKQNADREWLETWLAERQMAPLLITNY